MYDVTTEQKALPRQKKLRDIKSGEILLHPSGSQFYIGVNDGDVVAFRATCPDIVVRKNAGDILDALMTIAPAGYTLTLTVKE